MSRAVIAMDQRRLYFTYKKIPMKKIKVTALVLWLVVLVNFLGILSVLYAMVTKVSRDNLSKLISNGDTFSAIKTTLMSVGISLVFIGLIGIPVAYILATHKGTLYNFIEAITFIPLVLPPSVAGLGLLMTFGRHGMLGEKLSSWGVHLPFTFFAIVLVQVFVCLPFFIQIVKNEFEAIEIDVIEAAKVFGAGDRILLFKIFIPIGLKAISAGMLLCGLRAAGEFGATMMFAGNLAGKTQTLTTRIYSLYQYDVLQAVTLAVLQLVILLIPMLLLKYFSSKEKREE